jgi:DNA segregation ATPase FtsK/SpoIIIE, S-DNA-T family
VRESQPAPATARARVTAPVRVPGSTRPASTTFPTGWERGPSERQWNSKEPSTSPSTRARSPTSSVRAASEVATDSRPFVCRATAAPARRSSVGVPSPTPTSSTRRRSPLVRPAVSRTTRSTTSPAAPVASQLSSSAKRSSGSSSSSSAAPGPRVRPSGPASTGTATTSAPTTAEGATSLTATCGGDTWVGSATAPPCDGTVRRTVRLRFREVWERRTSGPRPRPYRRVRRGEDPARSGERTGS